LCCSCLVVVLLYPRRVKKNLTGILKMYTTLRDIFQIKITEMKKAPDRCFIRVQVRVKNQP
ncbi:hypothetical protein NVV43_31450, partial [Escherichia marmotae]|nr:hypothetical protein [Escherichia marmotae]